MLETGATVVFTPVAVGDTLTADSVYQVTPTVGTPAPAIQGWGLWGLAMALGGVGFAGLRLRRESA